MEGLPALLACMAADTFARSARVGIVELEGMRGGRGGRGVVERRGALTAEALEALPAAAEGEEAPARDMEGAGLEAAMLSAAAERGAAGAAGGGRLFTTSSWACSRRRQDKAVMRALSERFALRLRARRYFWRCDATFSRVSVSTPILCMRECLM